MVAGPWDWDFAFMLGNFGWKATLAVMFNALALCLWLRQDLKRLDGMALSFPPGSPWAIALVHLLFLAGIVYFAHYPVVFLGLVLLFLGFATAYRQHQSRLLLREALLVSFFLAGLVVLGGMQQWWLEPLLMGMSPDGVFYGALALTAVTDNAALTYLGSLVPGLSDAFKVALVAGAVAGGGLTVIANAPNPAGIAILRAHFPGQMVSALYLLIAAIPPTIVAILAYRLL